MATVTIASTTVPNYQSPGSTAELRIYATENFFGGGVEYVSGSGYFYKSVACTVAANVVTIPEFTLESTEDSTDDTAAYTAVLFDHTEARVTTLMAGMEFSVPPTPSSTTWQTLLVHNRAVVRRRDDRVYTVDQVDLLLQDLAATIGYTDERAQDAVGAILVDSPEIDLTYDDATPSIAASIVAGSIAEAKLSASVNASLDLADSALQPAAVGVTVQGYDADLAAIAALADPGADRILFWDDSAGAYAHLTVGSGLSIADTTLNATASGLSIGTAVSGGGAARILYEDASQNLAADADFTFDASSNKLVINTTEIHIGGAGTTNPSLFIGKGAGSQTQTGIANVGIGQDALSSLTDGVLNVGIGLRALDDLTSGDNNMAIGTDALSSVTTGNNNTAVGVNTLTVQTTQSSNTAIGDSAGRFATGSNAVYVGRTSGQGTSSGTPNSGSQNVGLGVGALGANQTAADQVGVGYLSLAAATTGGNNVAVGAQALTAVTTGQRNVAVGKQAGGSTGTGVSDCVFLGYQAGQAETNSNRLYIANSSTSTPLVYGEFPNAALYVTAQNYRQRYDASNYMNVTVGSTGAVTFDAVGAGAKFTFSDDVELADAKNVVAGTTTGSKIGTSAAQKLGFWNATPVVQPATGGAAATFAANTSAIADDTATFDGYTIGQVVKALRNIGVLA